MSWLKKVRNWFGKKVIIGAIGYIMVALREAHPDWPLPSPDFTQDLVLTLIGAHAATDIVAILKTTGKEVLAGKAQ